MAVEVYVWLPRADGNIGHASMYVDGGTPAGPMYLSQWPGSSFIKALTIGSACGQSYADDVKAEGGKPSVVRLTKLDETAVKKAIEYFQKHGLYGFFLLNCANQVKLCLDWGVSGMGHLATILGRTNVIGYQLNDTPWGVYCYARGLTLLYG